MTPFGGLRIARLGFEYLRAGPSSAGFDLSEIGGGPVAYRPGAFAVHVDVRLPRARTLPLVDVSQSSLPGSASPGSGDAGNGGGGPDCDDAEPATRAPPRAHDCTRRARCRVRSGG